MIEDLIKNARLSSSGRKLLTSQQKAFIVEDWESSGLNRPSVVLIIHADYFEFSNNYDEGKLSGFSVRCLKDY